MRISRKLAIDLTAGTLSSVILCTLLIKTIMAGGSGSSFTFVEFLQDVGGLLFSIMMALFIFASFLMRGINNRVVIFCWAVGMTINHTVLWNVYDYFYDEFRNIYMLFWSGTLSNIPLILIARYRVTASFIVLKPLREISWLSSPIHYYLSNIKSTDFEFYMERVLYTGLFIELFYSIYMSAYCILNRISFNESVTQHIERYNAWDPFNFYIQLLWFITLSYILIISFYLYRDYKQNDAYAYGLSDTEKRQISQKILEKYRKQAARKIKKERD